MAILPDEEGFQKDSLFFTRLSPEARNHIYSYALIAVPDHTRPRGKEHLFARPESYYALTTPEFHLTCRQAYFETHRLILYLNEHRISNLTTEPEPQISLSLPHVEIRDYFARLTNQQAEDVASVHLHIHQYWFDHSQRALKLLFTQNLKHLCLIVGLKGWYRNMNYHRVNLPTAPIPELQSCQKLPLPSNSPTLRTQQTTAFSHKNQLALFADGPGLI